MTNLIYTLILCLFPFTIVLIPFWKALINNTAEGNYRELPPNSIGFVIGIGISSYPWFAFFPNHRWLIGSLLLVAVLITIFIMAWFRLKNRPKPTNAVAQSAANSPKIPTPINNPVNIIDEESTNIEENNIGIEKIASNSIPDPGGEQATLQEDTLTPEEATQITKNPDKLLEMEARLLWLGYRPTKEKFFWAQYESLLSRAHQKKKYL